MGRIGTVGLVGVMVACLAGSNGLLAGEPNQWAKVSEGQMQRQGSTLVWASDLKKVLLVGGDVQAFDATKAAPAWAVQSTSRPDVKGGIHSYYQTAYDAKTKSVYCLSNSSVLYVFNVESGAWKANPPEPLLDGLSWHMLAGDGDGHIVVVGSDKRIDNVGWTRTCVYDATSGQWSTLPVPADMYWPVLTEHRIRVEVTERTVDIVGRIRLAWYHDPKGVGTDEEIKALLDRCKGLAALKTMVAFKDDIAKVAALLEAKNTLDALKQARALQRRIEDTAFDQYPVPCSRRNAPLVYDATNKVFVLFGGDHEDYQLNDTWTLDLAKKAWKRMKPDIAPSPRAGHAMCYLPKSGRVAIYEGYLPNASPDYGASPWQTLNPREMWVYDAKADRWDLVGTWPIKAGQGSKDAEGVAPAAPPAIGKFYGYSASWFEVPPMAADGEDTIILAAPGGQDRNEKPLPGTTWALKFDPTKLDAAGAGQREKLGKAPNDRRLRDIYFRADYSEVPDDPKAKDLATLPANQWVNLSPVRSPAHGCRQRDWGTAVWDSDNDQILLWGGGHCVRSSGTPLHYSPVSNRIVEGYDADEPYQYNGMCGPGSSLLGRQWIDTHGYHLYDYDPKCKLLVTARGFLYDPVRMDWLRAEPFKPPFHYEWGHVVLRTSPTGVLAWATLPGNRDAANLWQFDREKGWQDVKPTGVKLFGPWCDTDGMVYDSKRDRMLIGTDGAGKKGSEKVDGALWTFDFATKAVGKLAVENASLAPRNCREMAYVASADIVLFGSQSYLGGGEDQPKGKKQYTRVFDCANNRYMLLDAGAATYGHSCGWMFDAKRGMAYIFTFRGDAWGMRIDPKTIKLLGKAPE